MNTLIRLSQKSVALLNALEDDFDCVQQVEPCNQFKFRVTFNRRITKDSLLIKITF